MWTTRAVIASATPAHTTPRTLASLDSWPRCSVVSMPECLAEQRVVHREERSAVELPAEGREPDAAESDGRCQVHPVERQPVRLEVRHDEPEEVDVAHAEDARGHEEESMTFHGAREEEDERHREVEDDERDGDRRPAALLPAEIPGDLLRQVAGPDEEILGEGQVGP